jgi:hypothetical protein
MLTSSDAVVTIVVSCCCPFNVVGADADVQLGCPVGNEEMARRQRGLPFIIGIGVALCHGVGHGGYDHGHISGDYHGCGHWLMFKNIEQCLVPINRQKNC